MNAQLRKRRTVGKPEVVNDKVGLMTGSGPLCPRTVARNRRRSALRGCDGRAQAGDHGEQRVRNSHAKSFNARAILGDSYDPRRPDFIEVAGGFPALTGGAGGGAGG